MKTALFSLLFLLIGSLQIIAAPSIFPSPFTICLACQVPGGLEAGNPTNGTVDLSWDAVAGATQYTIEVQDEQNTPSTFHMEKNVIGTSYTISGLQAGVQYKFKVRSRCGGDKSDWSDWVFFKGSASTGGGSGSGPCATVTGLSVSINGGTATLSWTAVAGATKYYIEVEDEQNTPSTFHLKDSASTNTYSLSGLQTAVQYKFKVRAQCSSDWSAWMFLSGNGNTTGGGGSSSCAAPVALSASVSGGSAKLSWNSVSGASQYYLEVEDEQNVPSTFHLELSVQDSFHTLTGLQAGVSYKFKVSAHCAGGKSDWSAWVFFNGNTSGGTGGTSACAKPGGNTASNIGGTSALLSWAAVPGVSAYTIEIERNQAGLAPWQITQVVATNSFLLTGLDANTRYKFKVRSNCAGGGHSDWSGAYKFKTLSNVTSKASADDSLGAASGNRAEQKSLMSDDAAPAIQIYPNPAQTSTTVRLQQLNSEVVTLRLLNLSGRLVLEQILQPEHGAWEGRLALGDLPNGLYLLQMQNGTSSHTSKLMIQH